MAAPKAEEANEGHVTLDGRILDLRDAVNLLTKERDHYRRKADRQFVLLCAAHVILQDMTGGPNLDFLKARIAKAATEP